jgi:hypothetical protein
METPGPWTCWILSSNTSRDRGQDLLGILLDAEAVTEGWGKVPPGVEQDLTGSAQHNGLGSAASLVYADKTCL